MLGFRRIINYPCAAQLTGFISLFLRKAISNGRHGRTTSSKVQTSVVARNPTNQRHPADMRSTFFLCAGLLPVVKAWSPWKTTQEDEEEEKLGGPKRLRLIDKNDKKLKSDISKADELYDTGNTANYDEALRVLLQHTHKREPELLWRIGRITYEQSKIAKSASDKKKLVEQAYDLMDEALELDEKNFAAHKWMAIILNELSSLKGTKDQIQESFNVKKHMMRAAELNPDDATSIYLLGHWCYTVADIPWYQRKVAATLFASPPECSFQEAYKHFLQAEYTEPGFYSMNLLMLAKSALKIGDMEKAKKYLTQLETFKSKTDDDQLAKQEGKQLREKLFS